MICTRCELMLQKVLYRCIECNEDMCTSCKEEHIESNSDSGFDAPEFIEVQY